MGFVRLAAIMLSATVLGVYPPQLLAQRLLMDDFVYPAGDSLIDHGWSSTSLTNSILTSASGLQFGLYQGSGIGNAALLNSTGQDVQKEFGPDSAGTIFLWALVNVATARSGDYFLQLQPNGGSSVFLARTFAKLAANGAVAFGVAKRGTNTAPTVVYSDSVFSTGTTYLLVVKYEFLPETTSDDEVTLYIFENGTVPSSEPAVPTVGPVRDVTGDASVLGAVALRQGDQSRAPTLTIDGLRVTQGWDGWLPVTLDRLQASLNSDPAGVLLAWKSWSESGVEGFHLDRWSQLEGRYLPVTAEVIPGSGSSGQPVEYTYVDIAGGSGRTTYRLRVLTSGGGEFLADSVFLDIPTQVPLEDHPEFFLSQNYPNPFNPRSVIKFVSPETQDVSMDLYDVLGRHHGELFRGRAERGVTYEVEIDGRALSSGVYFARLKSMSGVLLRRMLIVR
jgi:hypothetical protein